MRFKLYSTFLLTVVACLALSGLHAQQLQSKTLTQIQSLLNEKATRTPVEKKISSQLLQAVREKQNVAMAQGVTTLRPVNVNADKNGKVPVNIKGNITDELLTKVESLGGKIIHASFAYHIVRADVNLTDLKTIAAFPEVKFIQSAVPSKLVGNLITPTDLDAQNKKREDILRKKLINYLRKNYPAQFAGTGPVTSEGDRAHRADDVRNTYGYSGAGIKIGVLSDSYNATDGAATDVLNGDLPGSGNPLGYTTPVTVLQDFSGGTDEGRAMLQIIHDIVPKAQLFFATADVTSDGCEPCFADNIKALRSIYHCDIIIDDVEYFDEPPFQDGMVAQAVNTVTADGAMYFSSAGNYGSVTNNTSGVYEGDFNDIGSPPFAGDTTLNGTIHNFGTVVTPITGNEAFYSGYYFLNWADPLGKSVNDYDLFLVSSAGDIVMASTDLQDGSEDPIEGFGTDVSSGDKLVVFKTSSAKRRAFHLNAGFASGGSQGLAIVTNGQTFGHSSAAEAFSVAATPAAATFTGLPPGPYPNAFDTTDQVEAFSSDGPRRIFWNADTTSVTPGNFLFSTGGGLTRYKPDITAADGVTTHATNTYFFDNLFYGTSAAAPHAGAIAALLKSAGPDLTNQQIRNLLTSTALDIEAHGVDDVSGHGIIQAFQAMQKLNPKAYAVINLDTAYAIDGSGSNNNGFIEPGETGNLVIGLNNTSIAQATNVRVILTTTTPGVTILQDSVFYNTIDSNGGISINTANPFLFKVDSSFTCGAIINLTATVKYRGGQFGTKTFEYSIVVGNEPYKTIAASLGHPLQNPTYVTTTGKQTGRLGRYINIGSVCGTLIANPGVSAAAGNGLRTYDAYTFTNNSSVSQCITVTLTTNSDDSLYSAAYNDSGFVPSLPSEHFIAEPQLITSGSFNYSFDVAAGKAFTVVVNEVDSVVSIGRPYTLDVSLRKCAQTVLAVNLFNLSAQADQVKQQIPLHWTVANDQQTRFYEVQRSTDGVHFSSLQTVTSALSASQKTYNYVDKTPAYGDNYYRIKKVDLNGVISYSNVAKAALQFSNDIVLMPNPASAYINVISKTNMGQVQLFDSKGQLLQTIKPQSSFYKLETGKLAAGQYFIRIQTANGIANEKFVKQ